MSSFNSEAGSVKPLTAVSSSILSRFLRVLATAAACMILLAGLVKSDTNTGELTVLVLDGAAVSYEGKGGEPNWKILEGWIKEGFPKSTVIHVDLGSRHRAVFLQAQELTALKPNMVVFHWSTFGSSPNEGYCRPFSRDSWIDCTDRILSLLQKIYDSDRSVAFVGYSRSENLCAKSFQASVKNRLKKITTSEMFASRTVLIAMGERVGKQWTPLQFRGEDVQNEWLQLIAAVSASDFARYAIPIWEGRICVLDGEK